MVEIMSFQENLKHYRKAAGFKTARDFAEHISVPYTTYISYENKDCEPKYEVLCKIASMLVVTTDELLGHNGESVWRSNYEAAQHQLDAIRNILGVN